jgi:serine phosphatase RsbU (regulator of sigma subunit)
MKHIILAEDQPSGRLIVSFALKEAGFRVTAAENGAEALEKISEAVEAGEPYDLLVTDVDMPEMNGVELIDELVAADVAMPIIVMTAIGTKHLVVELMRRGVTEYIDKPFEPPELVAMARDALAKDEERRRKEEEKDLAAAEERADLMSRVDSYKISFDKLKREVESAKGAYDNLVSVDKENLPIKFEYRLQPLADLGGDFIDVRRTSKGADFLIADVAGHDMGASFHAVLIKTLFEENCKLENDGVAFFTKLNQTLLENGKNERMVTGQFVRFDVEAKKVEIVSAGHPYPIMLAPGSAEPEFVKAQGDVLGVYEDPEFEKTVADFPVGARLLFLTDGLTDVYAVDGETGDKKRLTEDALNDYVRQYAGEPLEALIENVWREVLRYCNFKYKDDMTLVGVESA